MIRINNRRYLGNKHKLLKFIKKVVENECPNAESFFDVFSGTGVVASAFTDMKIITNDILYSNFIVHNAFFGKERYNADKVNHLIKEFNAKHVDSEPENYMSINFADTYFSHYVSKKIGYIRDEIEALSKRGYINDRERSILITSLIYAMDKIATTVGHYDAFRKNVEFNNKLHLKMLDIDSNTINSECYNEDANDLVRRIQADIVYLDPPYNSRQYSDAYHLLENIAKWEKPEVFGVAKKMDRQHIKSDYCTRQATQTFEDLINNIDAKYIILSYNNTGEKSDDRSNARISDEDIVRILKQKGHVKVFETDYKAFTTGKSNINDNKERLFLCSTEKVASPLNYTGGKFKLLKQIQPLFPSNIDTFVDLFAGGFNVGINVPSEKTVFNDINGELIGLFKTLKKLKTETVIKRVEKIIVKYGLSDVSKFGYDYYNCNSSDGLANFNKDKFLNLRNDFNKLKVKNSDYYIMLYVLIVFSFNNQIRFNKSGEFNLPVGKRDFNNKMREKLIRFSHRLQDQDNEIKHSDYKKLSMRNLTENSLVYADPPYLITLASYNEQGGWNEEKEVELLNYLDEVDKRNVKFALSNVLYHKGRENEILKDWIQKNNGKYIVNFLDYSYSNSNYQTKDKDTKSIEVLITNY